MAASTSSPLAITSPSTTMNTTTTEHDYRFPRRPFERGGVHADRPYAEDQSQSPASTKKDAAAEQDSPGDWRLQELNLDISKADGSPSKPYDLLRTSLFPNLRNDIAGTDENLEQMRENDPLATQVWTFFRKTKQSLPNRQRMENLTWRMMYANLRKRAQEEQERYVSALAHSSCLVVVLCCCGIHNLTCAFSNPLGPYSRIPILLMVIMHPAGLRS